MKVVPEFEFRSTWDAETSTLRIHRGDWGNGTREDYDKNTAMFDAFTGRSCCVGVAARAMGADPALLHNRGGVHCSWLPQNVWSLFTEDGEDPRYPTGEAFIENDGRAYERRLIAIFADPELGITLEFFGDADDAPKRLR